jgi:hypothetical protein
VDFLSNERFLPVRVITVRLAATIFAFELGEWNGAEIPESEFEPFMQPPSAEHSLRGATSPHSWRLLELTGTVRRARDAIEALLLQSIEAGRLPVLNERRDLTGVLDACETLLDVEKVRDWAEVHGLEPGDFFTSYVDEENEIALAGLSRINDERSRLENPDEYTRVMERVAGLDADSVLELIRENERLRARERDREPPDLPLDSRQRTTLLTIIGALASAANLDLSQPYKAGGAVAVMLDRQGVKLAGRTIGDHLRAVHEAMDRRKGT